MYETVIRQLEVNQTLTPEQKQKVLQNIGPSFDAAIKESQGMVTDPKVIDETMEKSIGIYASHFTVSELKEVTAFYKTPTGQKFLEKTPIVMQQTMAAGKKFGEVVGAEAQQEMVDELRKKGHAI